MFIEISFCPVHDGDGGQKQISPEAGNVPTWQFATLAVITVVATLPLHCRAPQPMGHLPINYLYMIQPLSLCMDILKNATLSELEQNFENVEVMI